MENTDGGERAKLNVEIFLPGSFQEVPVPAQSGFATVTRTRLKIEGRDETHSDALALELWDVADDPQRLVEPYRVALRTAAELGAISRLSDGPTLLAYAEAGSPRIMLAELGGSPLSVKHSTETGLFREPGDETTAKLAAYELGTATVAVLVTLQGSGSRGQGHFRTAQGELWTLTAEGFTRGASLPVTVSSDTSHGSAQQRTALYWVDADGVDPPEVLALHRYSSDGTWAGIERYPGWDERRSDLFAFDATLGAFKKVDRPPEIPPEVLRNLTRGAAFAAF